MVSKDEYTAFAEMTSGKDFMMMDMNEDGMISEAEWTSTLHPTCASPSASMMAWAEPWPQPPAL